MPRCTSLDQERFVTAGLPTRSILTPRKEHQHLQHGQPLNDHSFPRAPTYATGQFRAAANRDRQENRLASTRVDQHARNTNRTSQQANHNDGRCFVHCGDRRWSATVRRTKSKCTHSSGERGARNHLSSILIRALPRLFHRYGCESLREDLQRKFSRRQFAPFEQSAK